MRNLLSYPITSEEVIRAARRASRDYDEKMASLPPHEIPCGDLQGVALEKISEILEILTTRRASLQEALDEANSRRP